MGHYTAVLKNFDEVWEASVYECTPSGPILALLICGSLAFVLRYEELARALRWKALGARRGFAPRKLDRVPFVLDHHAHA